MKRKGVDEIFFAGTSLTEMADYVKKHYGKRRKKRRRNQNRDLVLAREFNRNSKTAEARKTSTVEISQIRKSKIEHRK